MKIHIEINDDKSVCYLSQAGLKPNASDVIGGKMLIDLFPNYKKVSSLALMLEDSDPAKIPVVLISDEEYESRFGDI